MPYLMQQAGFTTADARELLCSRRSRAARGTDLRGFRCADAGVLEGLDMARAESEVDFRQDADGAVLCYCPADSGSKA